MSFSKQFKLKDKYYQKLYGITYIEFLTLASDGCMICGTLSGRLCLDHIHQKGFKTMPSTEKRKYIRGVLCFLCNTALKGFEKTVDGKRNRKQLENTLKYFITYKLKGEL